MFYENEAKYNNLSNGASSLWIFRIVRGIKKIPFLSSLETSAIALIFFSSSFLCISHHYMGHNVFPFFFIGLKWK